MSTRPRRAALVVYESIFGNTRSIAQAIGRGLAADFDVKVVEVSQAGTDLGPIDLLVVGGPVHAFGMTRDSTREDARRQARAKQLEPVSPGIGVRDWLDALPPLPSTLPDARPVAPTAAVFDTVAKVGWFTAGSAARGEAARLKERGFVVIVPPEHFYVTGVDGPLVEGEIERATDWARQLVEPRAAAPPAHEAAAYTG